MIKRVEKSLTSIYRKISERENNAPITFNEFMNVAAQKPNLVFRNIFRKFYDMIYSYVGDGIDEYPDDPESVDFVYYDTKKLFVEGTDHPFFADRMFANRLINHFASFGLGAQQNRIYIFEGPHGCGKSTFLNNLLMKFEQYTNTEEGTSYETVWRLNKKELGLFSDEEFYAIMTQYDNLADDSLPVHHKNQRDKLFTLSNKMYLEVPCPSHDSPLLLIPKAYRKEFLNNLIKDEDFKEKLFSEKEYEWVFRDNPCTICASLYQTLLEKCDTPSRVFQMVFARKYNFNRRLGDGISVFNPGDRIMKTHVLTNKILQEQLDGILKDSNRVRYIFSQYAKTNNGVYALMDIKAHNKKRFENLHGIISEGVHKVEHIEENVNSLFLAIMNPEDQVELVDAQSFLDRITYIKIPYVLDYNTEVKIYKSVFGDQIERSFLPRVLQNFAKVIIASRLKPQLEGIREWIDNPEKYRLYCDENLQLLKMDIYTGVMPSWISEEDRKKYTAERRRKLVAESELEGDKGLSGRDSINIFNEFFAAYAKKDKFISMQMVYNFFSKHGEELKSSVSGDFLNALVNHYNYMVLQEVKESLYYYNEERISKDIQNYIFGVNFELGQVQKCVYTGEELVLTEEFFKSMENLILGPELTDVQKRNFRKDIQYQYTSKTLTQEIMSEGKGIRDTELYESLHERYLHNIKEKVMEPFLENDNFRNAIKDFATSSFKTYDKRIRDDVTYLVNNMKAKYGYPQQGAKEVCIYVIDQDLARKFSESA